MPDVTVHDVPEEELAALEARAERHGRTSEDELRHLLHEAAAEELLVLDLERAARAVEEKLEVVEKRTHHGEPQPRRRYRAVEPTPRNRTRS